MFAFVISRCNNLNMPERCWCENRRNNSTKPDSELSASVLVTIVGFSLCFLGVSRLAAVNHRGKCTAVVITIRS